MVSLIRLELALLYQKDYKINLYNGQPLLYGLKCEIQLVLSAQRKIRIVSRDVDHLADLNFDFETTSLHWSTYINFYILITYILHVLKSTKWYRPYSEVAQGRFEQCPGVSEMPDRQTHTATYDHQRWFDIADLHPQPPQPSLPSTPASLQGPKPSRKVSNMFLWYIKSVIHLPPPHIDTMGTRWMIDEFPAPPHLVDRSCGGFGFHGSLQVTKTSRRGSPPLS